MAYLAGEGRIARTKQQFGRLRKFLSRCYENPDFFRDDSLRTQQISDLKEYIELLTQQCLPCDPSLRFHGIYWLLKKQKSSEKELKKEILDIFEIKLPLYEKRLVIDEQCLGELLDSLKKEGDAHEF